MAAYRVLQLPAVADKTFLVTIGDRTVGGLCARDPMVGPWQVPVADVGVSLIDYDGYAGEAMAIGERTPLALIDAPASGRMAVGEAITNISAAPIGDISAIKLSANWMAPAGHPGEDAALYDTVRAVAMELCPGAARQHSRRQGFDVDAHDVARRRRREGGHRAGVADRLGLRADSRRAPRADAAARPRRRAARRCCGSISAMGGIASADRRWRRSTGSSAANAPTSTMPRRWPRFFAMVQELHRDGLLLAYHDIGDGGLFATLVEMAFASRCGLDIALPQTGGPLAVLFAEELGAVVQVRAAQRDAIAARLAKVDLVGHWLGAPTPGERIRIRFDGKTLLDESRVDLHRAWSATTHAMQRMRDNPDAADDEYARILDTGDPGIAPRLTFDPADDIAAPYIATGARPAVAVLREQGVNGQVEMAAAFDRAGFAAHDVHMSDILSGRTSLAAFKGFVACGGFSYGDVLGAGEGWAKSILFNARARDDFAAFFARRDVFALGVCNGCQMMSNLAELIPGTEHWPHFVRNRSEQFEGRLVLLEVVASPSLFFRGMEGSLIPAVTAHGEGYAEFRDAAQLEAARPYVTLRFVDGQGAATMRYPYNANGSPLGITGLTTADGRFSILMPHPERVFRTVQMSWHPPEWGEDSPWMRIFRNARAWLG